MLLLKAVYSPSVVILSFGIAFLGSYLTITFCELLRKVKSSTLMPKLLGTKSLLAIMAVSLGGIGIWSMHFIGMSSLRLIDEAESEAEPVVYNLLPTLISMIVVIIFAFAGLYIASLDPMFGKTKQEIVTEFVNKASKMSFKDIMHITHFRMLVIITTQSLGRLITGGIIAGGGVSVMHYLGMWAMRLKDGVIHWNAGIIAASVLIAIIAATAAFWILFRLLSLYPHLEMLRIASSFLMAVAVTGMHYTGMMAAEFRFKGDAQSASSSGVMKAHITSEDAFLGALLASLLLSVILFMASLSEHRHRMFQLTGEVKRFSDIIEKLQRAHENADSNSMDALLKCRSLTSPAVSVRKMSTTHTKENAVVVPLSVESIAENELEEEHDVILGEKELKYKPTAMEEV